MTRTDMPVTTDGPKNQEAAVGKPAIAGMSEEGEHLVEGAQPSRANTSGTSRADRAATFAVEAFPPPTGREEEWRFTPLKRFEPLLSSSPSQVEEPGWRIHTPPDELICTVIDRDRAHELALAVPSDRIAALSAARAQQVTELCIPAEAELDGPVRLHYHGGDGPSHQHLLIRVGSHAHATVVLDHTGRGHHSHLVGVQAESGSQLTVISVQRWQDDAVHAAQHDLLIGKDAYVKHIAVSLGGSAVRMNVNARFASEGGSTELLGLYYADGGQHLEHRVFVDHNAPRCRSNVLYKGALQGQDARTVWVGDVLIEKQAEGTDSYEKNQNLILTDGARADSVPNLEIETGLIEGAGHASSTGRFDDEHLFYLMARGIPREQAQRLVVQGYLNEIIQKIGIPALEEELTLALDTELEAAGTTL